MSKERNNGFESMVNDIQRRIEKEAKAIFSKKVIEEYQNPKNVGRMSNPDGEACITGPCGDTMEIYLIVENCIIKQALF